MAVVERVGDKLLTCIRAGVTPVSSVPVLLQDHPATIRWVQCILLHIEKIISTRVVS